MWDTHRCVAEDVCLQACDAVLLTEKFQIIQKSAVPSLTRARDCKKIVCARIVRQPYLLWSFIEKISELARPTFVLPNDTHSLNNKHTEMVIQMVKSDVC
jgi:hypothetical protein